MMEKISNKIVAIILAFTIISILSIFVYGHSVIVDIEYDECINLQGADGRDEAWYWLENSSNIQPHIGNNVPTIKYYFEEQYYSSTSGVTYTWSIDDSDYSAEEIKQAYANSMKKWNDIYYYSYDTNGNRITNKIVDVVDLFVKVIL